MGILFVKSFSFLISDLLQNFVIFLYDIIVYVRIYKFVVGFIF